MTKKHIAEYIQKHAAINDRYANMVFGIPKYSLKYLKTTNKKNAVAKAPILSTKNSVFGFEDNFPKIILIVFLIKIANYKFVKDW